LLTPVTLASQEAEIGKTVVPGQSGEKVARPNLNQYLGVILYAWYPSYVGCLNRKMMVQASLGKKKSKPLPEK
jgi:hypothetical protein